MGNNTSDSIDLHGVASWLHEGALRQNSRDFIIAAIVMGLELREGVFSQNRVAMELSNDAELVENSFVTRSRTTPNQKLHDKIGSICWVRANRQ